MLKGCRDDSDKKYRNKGSIYAAKQGMRPCNTNSMHNPRLKDVGIDKFLIQQVNWSLYSKDVI